MTDKERLEEIKLDVKMTRKDLAVSPSNEMTLNMGILLNTMDYLIERVQELEEDLRLSEAEEYSRGKQNKRYRDSIKKAISYFNYDEHQRGMAELQKALEESQ